MSGKCVTIVPGVSVVIVFGMFITPLFVLINRFPILVGVGKKMYNFELEDMPEDMPDYQCDFCRDRYRLGVFKQCPTCDIRLCEVCWDDMAHDACGVGPRMGLILVDNSKKGC